MNTMPTREYLLECFDYCEKSGIVVWKTRPEKHFKNIDRMKKFNKKWAGKQVGYLSKWGHLFFKINGKNQQLHRIIFKMMTGVEPTKQIDHIDGNGSNNAWDNIREADNSTNGFNKLLQKNNTTGFKGVYWNAECKKFAAKVEAYGQRIYLGLFDSAELAHKAYIEKAIELHGEFHNPGY